MIQILPRNYSPHWALSSLGIRLDVPSDGDAVLLDLRPECVARDAQQLGRQRLVASGVPQNTHNDVFLRQSDRDIMEVFVTGPTPGDYNCHSFVHIEAGQARSCQVKPSKTA